MPTTAAVKYESDRSIPKKLRTWCDANADKVEEVNHDSDGWWVYVRQEWYSDEMECRTIHEDTASACLAQLRSLVPANGRP